MARNFGFQEREWSEDKDHDANHDFRLLVWSVIGVVGTSLFLGGVAILLWLASMTFEWPP